MAKTQNPAPVIDVFSSAVTVNEAEALNTGSILVGDNLDIINSIDTIVETLNGARAYYETELKKEVRPQYILRGFKLRHRPSNLSLETPSGATCSAEWRQRGSNSELSAQEIKVLEKHKISTQTVTVKKAVPEQYFFDSEALADPNIRAAISKAFSMVPELAGKQLIKHQAAIPAVTKTVVGDSALEEVFAKAETEENISDLLRVCSVSAFKVKGSGDLESSFKTLERVGLGNLINASKK